MTLKQILFGQLVKEIQRMAIKTVFWANTHTLHTVDTVRMPYEIRMFYTHIHRAYFIAQMTMNTGFIISPDANGTDNTHQPVHSPFHTKVIAEGPVHK